MGMALPESRTPTENMSTAIANFAADLAPRHPDTRSALAIFASAPSDESALQVAGYLETRSASSRRTMRAALDSVAAIMRGLEPGRANKGLALASDWAGLTPKVAPWINAMLRKRTEAGAMAATTANKWLAAVRGLVRHMWQVGSYQDLGGGEYRERIVAGLGNVPTEQGEKPLTGRMLTPSEIRSLLIAARDQPHASTAARDLAMLALLRSGMRRAEVAGALVENINQGGACVKVLGKGRKWRNVALGPASMIYLERWLAIRGGEPGPILSRIGKGGEVRSAGVTPQAIRDRVVKLAKGAGIEAACHDFRRTTISELLDAGVDLVTVQGMAGHSNPRTTARYDRRGDDKRIESARVLALPIV